MPLHEYLEQKRRQNVAELNAIGACHICGSTCRNSRGFYHYFLDDDDVDVGDVGDVGAPPPPPRAASSSSSSLSALSAASSPPASVGGGGGATMMTYSSSHMLCSGGGGGGGGGDEMMTNNNNNYSSENSMVRPPNLAAMRTCSCFGIAPTDPDYWPYSLRVCDRCIEDDRGIGRIRNCGICGTVACDENCGPVLLECTDSAEWNNAGCIECRKMGDFSEMDIFKRCTTTATTATTAASAIRGGGMGGDETTTTTTTRITRVCTRCLEQSTPWVRYDFVCRRFRCETRLVPSDVAERKRFRTFGSSPLNLLSEDCLVAVVDFLSGSDLKQLFLTCSAMCTVAERVAKEKVENIRDIIPTGPIVIEKRTEGNGQTRNWTHLVGTNDHGLRAPDDERVWVGVYHYVEKILREAFYFGFQMTGTGADKEVVGRFINQGRDAKFAFGRTYFKYGPDDDLMECSADGYSLRGGTVLVKPSPPSCPLSTLRLPLVFASSQRLETGIHHVICRLFCPGSGAARGNRDNRDLLHNFKLGSIGILRANIRGDGPTNEWARREDIMEPWMKEEVVIGIKYDADRRALHIHSNSHQTRASRFTTNYYHFDPTPGDLYIAAELTDKSASVAQTLLSVRNCDAEEWTKFIEHTREGSPLPAMDFNHPAFDEDLEEAMVDHARIERDQQNPARARHRVFHEAVRNRRRLRINDDDDDDDEEGGNQQRNPVRMAMEGGRRNMRFPRLRLAAPQVPERQEAQIIDLAAEEDAIVAAEEGPAPAPPPQARRVGHPSRRLILQALPRPPSNNNLDGEARPVHRRLLRALRPFARAAAMAEELHEDADDGDLVVQPLPPPMEDHQLFDLEDTDDGNEE